MEQLNAAIAICAGTVFLLGLISARLQLSPVSRPLLALAFGVVAGPLVLGLLVPHTWGDQHAIVKEAARVTLAISVMGIALRTPRADSRRLLRPVAVLLTLGMLGMWLVSTALAWGILGLSPLVALALGAVVTPTDPVVASSIATGGAAERILPGAVRSTLSLESGSNDGLGFALVMLPALALEQGGMAAALPGWLWDVLVIGILQAVAVGAATGALAAWLLHRADRAGWVEEHSLLGASVALSLCVLTLAKLLGSDGILAAFVAGVAFNFGVDRSEDFEEQNVQETISKLFSLPIFVLLGAALPVSAWTELGWAVLAFALAVLLLRRPITLIACYLFLGKDLGREGKVFLGWFAPVGIAALYYGLLLTERTGAAIYWEATSLAIVASVVAHGVTSGPGLKLYQRVT